MILLMAIDEGVLLHYDIIDGIILIPMTTDDIMTDTLIPVILLL